MSFRGITKVKYPKENMAALQVKLTKSEVAGIRNIVDAAEVHEADGFTETSRDSPPLNRVLA